MSLRTGDRVVVPGCGVGRVVALEAVDAGEGCVQSYRIDLDGGGRVWVPLDRIDEQGVRRPMDQTEVERAWTLISGGELPEKLTHWNRRHRRYRQVVFEHRPHELAALIGELVAIGARKGGARQALSFGEKRILERAQKLLAAEIAVSTGQELDDVQEKMAEVIATAA